MQLLLEKFGIHHECAPPYTPQYSGVFERALRLSPGKTIALLRGTTEGKTD